MVIAPRQILPNTPGSRSEEIMQIKRFINIHTILLLVFLVTIGGLVYRFFNWGERINLDEIVSDGEERPDTLDMILPLVDEDGNIISDKDDETTIVCFGNAPFADDRNSSDNLANMIAEKTGATVYNCSVGPSYLAAENTILDPSYRPIDAYNFYWLAQVAVRNDAGGHEKATKYMRDDTPPEGQQVYDTLRNLDFTQVDVIVVMYDAKDYFAGHQMYSDSNPTDIQQFTGNLEAGIELLKGSYPWIRIIVMSPTYAYAINEEGHYISSDQYTYGQDVLSTYAIKQQQSCSRQGVTFIDHIYGTITEDNAKDYLIDNYHLNVAGRELVANRFVEALYYYDE